MNNKKLHPFRANVLFKKDSVNIVSTSDIDMDIVNVLYSDYYDELKILDKWALFSEHSLINKVKKLIFFINGKYVYDTSTDLYRGFRSSGPQDKLNLKVSGLFKKTLIDKPGHKGKFKSTFPLSFSQDFDISKSFGDNVIKITGVDIKDILPLTDEISYVINKFRGFDVSEKMETQNEVILLPHNKEIEFQLILSNGKDIRHLPGSATW